jgi:hypothetical protein
MKTFIALFFVLNNYVISFKLTINLVNLIIFSGKDIQLSNDMQVK